MELQFDKMTYSIGFIYRPNKSLAKVYTHWSTKKISIQNFIHSIKRFMNLKNFFIRYFSPSRAHPVSKNNHLNLLKHFSLIRWRNDTTCQLSYFWCSCITAINFLNMLFLVLFFFYTFTLPKSTLPMSKELEFNLIR